MYTYLESGKLHLNYSNLPSYDGEKVLNETLCKRVLDDCADAEGEQTKICQNVILLIIHSIPCIQLETHLYRDTLGQGVLMKF